MDKLTTIRKTDPNSLVDFPDFVYHRGSVLGKGSYGKVYGGWVKPSHEDIAVKVVKSEFYESDAKVRENLYREIDIQEDLKECKYVVRLYCRVERPEGLYLVMEKCDYDLQHHLNTVKALNEAATKDFLFQLGHGIEFMHKKGIVHRDLKPANILLVRDGHGGVVVKLADFGFARHFRKGEGTKPLDMTSLAGTPVFMAPEALECVFYRGKHYDEKVDMWSVGAVLYQCLVGRPAFYAQLQEILPILKKKGDAIAFKRGRSGQIQYIKDLPSDVDSRLSKRFKMQMNLLLRQLLQVSASKRLSYDEFFSFVNQLNLTPLDVYCPNTGKKFAMSAAIESPCAEISRLIADASNIALEDQILFDLESGIMINPLSTGGLPAAVLQRTDQWTFIVMSKLQLSAEEPPPPDEEYMHSLAKLLDDPGRAIGIVQAEGLSVMCAEVVESANEIRQAITAALSSYRNVVQGSQQQLYDIRTDLRLERERYMNGCGSLIEMVDEDFKSAVSASYLTEQQRGSLQAQLTSMTNKHAIVANDLSRCELQCTETYDAMSCPDVMQTLSSMAEDLTPLLEECQRIGHFKGQLLVSSTKGLMQQCQQKHRQFLRQAHERLRMLFFHAHSVPQLSERVRQLSDRCSGALNNIKLQRRSFRTELFQSLAQFSSSPFQPTPGGVSAMASVAVPTPVVTTVASNCADDEDDVDGGGGGVRAVSASIDISAVHSLTQELTEQLSQLNLDKTQLLGRVSELEDQLHSHQTSGVGGSIWEMIGSADCNIDQVTGAFPINVLPSNSHLDAQVAGHFPAPSNSVERTLLPEDDARTPEPSAPEISPSATLAPTHRGSNASAAPSARDQLDLEATRLALSQLLGFTQKLQEIVSYQASGDVDDLNDSLSSSADVGGQRGGDSNSSGGFMDTWRAATGISGMSMLNDTKLVESIKTMVDLSSFVERDALKAAVRTMTKQISYKNFTVGQVVLFLAVSKKNIFACFHDNSRGGERYFLRSTSVPEHKSFWALGTLKSAPKIERAADTRNSYGQPKYSSYYVMEADIFLTGSGDL